MKKILISLFASTFLATALPQQLTNWQNYTDMKQVKSIQSNQNGVWAATGGGGFYYNSLLNEYTRLTKTEGLFSTSLTAVCVDNYGKIWFGGSAGDLNVYNPNDNSIRTLLDIYNSDKVNKQINDLSVSGDTILISTEFGLTVVDSKSLVFYDTFYKFGNLSSNIRVTSTFKDQKIYAATEFGIAIQKDGATNLSAPESWNVFNTSNGLPSNLVRKIKNFNNTIIAATDKGLASFDGFAWQVYLPDFVNVNIKDIFISNDSLFILNGNTISVYYQGIVNAIFNSPIEIGNISSSQGGLYAASPQGIIKIESSNYKFVLPNGPAANQFPNTTVDKKGNFWSASGNDVSGVGIYKFDGNNWETYDTEHYPELFQNGYYSIFCSSDNSIYSGNWGQGFVKINSNGIQRFHSGNTGMIGIPNGNNFIVITGFGEDSKNNIWILNLRAADTKSLYMLSPDSVWYSFRNPLEQHSAFSEVKNLCIDQYDTKWYSMTGQGSMGLFYYNERGTYTSSADDFYGYITNSVGLNDNTINCIVSDKRGDLWIGTGLGVNIITNTSTVLSANPQIRISSVFVLRQQTINCIAVDPLNQKWVGTNQGLLLVNSDGSRLLETYDSKNSPLLSDVIRSLTIDEDKGIIYVGTDAGLISFETPAVKPLENFDELYAYPNPFLLENKNELLTIDGLIKDSEIKILGISGKLVSAFSSPGGRVAYWDGKDTDGKPVGTGIYIIVAYDKDGNNVATTKVAVLRNN